MASLVRALLATGSRQEAGRQASRALTAMTDPAQRAETWPAWRWSKGPASAT
jgi:hypothetical protein